MSEKKIIILVVAAAIAISLVHSFYFRLEAIVDASAYDRIAMNIVEGFGYHEWRDVPLENDFSIARVGPGYEFLLAGVYKIFGHYYWLIWILQAIFHGLTVLLIYLSAKKIFFKSWHPLIGIAAAGLIAFSPDLIVASSMLLTENVAIFLLSGCIYYFASYWYQSNWRNTVLLSMFFSSAVLVRSQLALLAPVFLIMFWMKKDWKKAAVFLAIIAAFFSPWVIRNYQIFKAFIPFNAAVGYNLWNGNHLGASGEMAVDYQPLIDYHASHSAIDVHREGIAQFKSFVLREPAEFLKITLKRVSIFFSFARPTGFWPGFSNLQKIMTLFLSAVYSIIIFTFGFAGIWLALKKGAAQEKTLLKFLIFAAAAIPLSVIFIIVETRYRYPIYPILAIFGGWAIYHLRYNFINTLKPISAAFLILLVNTMADVFNNLDRIFRSLGR